MGVRELGEMRGWHRWKGREGADIGGRGGVESGERGADIGGGEERGVGVGVGEGRMRGLA